MYVRVRDKETRHQFDILEESFDDSKHEYVKTGTLKGTRARPKPPKLNQSYLGKKTTSPADAEPDVDEDEDENPGEPSGGNEEKKEVH